VVLIALGLVFFAATQGVFDLTWGTIWPLFPMIAGGFILLQALHTFDARSRAGAVMGGTILLLVGAFFFTTTLGLIDWSDQAILWPVYVLIVGVAFFAAYFASGMTERGYLVPASILTIGGLLFLSITLLGSYALMGKIWPIFLIIGGVIILIGPRARRAHL